MSFFEDNYPPFVGIDIGWEGEGVHAPSPTGEYEVREDSPIGLFPWRIVPQGDNTVKVIDNGYLYGDGDDPVVWEFQSVADKTEIVSAAGKIWLHHVYDSTDEIIHDEQAFGSGHPDVHTLRKVKGTDTIEFQPTSSPPTGGNTDVFSGAIDLYVEIGEVDLVAGVATLVRQVQREYFFLPQDTFVLEEADV
jgi:hypothetical protein